MMTRFFAAVLDPKAKKHLVRVLAEDTTTTDEDITYEELARLLEPKPIQIGWYELYDTEARYIGKHITELRGNQRRIKAIDDIRRGKSST